jgi:hypothetical protein
MPRTPPPLFVWEQGGEEALELLPDHLHTGIRDYLEHGLRPGHFLCAVICNDLSKAAQHADHINALHLVEVVKFFLAFAPDPSWGSAEKLEAWLRERGQEAFEVNVARVQEFSREPLSDGDLQSFVTTTAKLLQLGGVTIEEAGRAMQRFGAAIEGINLPPEKLEELRALITKAR